MGTEERLADLSPRSGMTTDRQAIPLAVEFQGAKRFDDSRMDLELEVI